MATFDNQALAGSKRLVGALGGNVYNFIVPTPNPLIQEVLCDVYLECDSTLGAIEINLPAIGSGAGNAKVYISDVAGNAAVENITVKSDVVLVEKINGAASVVIATALGAVEVKSVNSLAWLAVGTF